MSRNLTLSAVLFTSISGSAFSMVNQHIKCFGFDSDKKIEIESLLEQDGAIHNLLWTTGIVTSPRKFESGAINMFPSELIKFSYDAAELNVSLGSSLNSARIEFQYNFKTQKGHGEVVVPTQMYGVEIKGAAHLSCSRVETEAKKTLPQPPMPSGIYNYQLPSDTTVSIALQVEETQITFNILGSSDKVVMTSKNGLTWNSTDAKCPITIQSTTGTGRTSDTFYLSEPTACEYARNLGLSLAGPYRLAQ